MRTPPIKSAVVVIAGALTLGACATFSPDRGMSVTANVADQALHKDVMAIRTQEDDSSARARVRQLLKRPLTADTAVQIALLNNRGLQAAYNELGIADALRVQQSLPPNPSVAVTRVSGPVETEIDRQIVGSILALATLPVRTEIAADRFRQAQLFAALETLRVATKTRLAYYRVVAARQLIDLLTQTSSAAETATKLAKRLGETGAMNKLDQAREQVFYADLTTQLATERQHANSAREQLIRSLGLWGSDLAFTLPKSLPALPRRPQTMLGVEQETVKRRVDLQIARIELDTLAKSYGLTQATRFINVLDAGYVDKITKNKETGERIKDRGFSVAIEVPVFDFGEARVREAEQTYMQAVNRLAEKAINVRSEARDAYRNYRSTYDIAAHYQREILPLRKIISDEMMLRYGAMQVDVFPLLAEARQRIAANSAAVETLRNFWIASTDLSAAIIGGASAGTGNDDISNFVTPPAGGAVSH
ncbi:MAG: TolC family protein [Rhizobiales bacterium]|nr:TolC family protein [Hyphomicrobiales bacterium]